MISAPAYRYPNVRVIVFAKEPIAGQVKTRLQKRLSADAALALHIAMLKWVCNQIRQASLCPLLLYVTSNSNHKEFLSICNKKDIYIQKGVDLGAKMANAASECLAEPGVDKVIIVGADCPALSASYLSQAINVLGTNKQVVFGPAIDGGYVLLGLRQVYDELFQDITWGSEKVLSQSMAQLEAKNRTYHLLSPLWDVDRPEDLDRLATEIPDFGLSKILNGGAWATRY